MPVNTTCTGGSPVNVRTSSIATVIATKLPAYDPPHSYTPFVGSVGDVVREPRLRASAIVECRHTVNRTGLQTNGSVEAYAIYCKVLGKANTTRKAHRQVAADGNVRPAPVLENDGATFSDRPVVSATVKVAVGDEVGSAGWDGYHVGIVVLITFSTTIVLHLVLVRFLLGAVIFHFIFRLSILYGSSVVVAKTRQGWKSAAPVFTYSRFTKLIHL